jgi:hypothetical protein
MDGRRGPYHRYQGASMDLYVFQVITHGADFPRGSHNVTLLLAGDTKWMGGYRILYHIYQGLFMNYKILTRDYWKLTAKATKFV